MGLILSCEKCGGSQQGIAIACRHVVSAVKTSAPWFDADYRAYGDVDDSDLGIIYMVFFCLPCIDRLGLPPNGTYLSKKLADSACAETDGVCGGCLGRWMAEGKTVP
jgi:hypothetical protein